MSRDSEKGRYTSPEGSALWEYIAMLSCAFLLFTLGFVAGWNSPTLAILMGPDTPVPLTAADVSTLSSAAGIGNAVAPTLIIVMANKLGRKNSLLTAGIPMIMNWLLIGVSQRLMVLFAARFIGGLSLGLIMSLPPMYLGEIASVKLRGAIGIVCGAMFYAGILFMIIIVPYLSVQTMAQVCLIITTIAVIGVWFIPESPYFLAMIGKFDEAEGSLEKLRGKTDVAEELELIKKTVGENYRVLEDRKEGEEQDSRKISTVFKKLFTVPGNRKALSICLLFQTLSHFGGHITIGVYGEIIFGKMNTGISGHSCMIIISTLQLISNILTSFIIERIGRRPLLCMSGISSGVSLTIVTVYFYLMEYTKVDVTSYGIFAFCAVITNFISFSIGLMPILMVLNSEILATDVKALATCISGVSGGIMGSISMKFYLTMAETWGLGHSVPFLAFAVFTLSCTIIILKLLPETKGKTLFEIQKDFHAP